MRETSGVAEGDGQFAPGARESRIRLSFPYNISHLHVYCGPARFVAWCALAYMYGAHLGGGLCRGLCLVTTTITECRRCVNSALHACQSKPVVAGILEGKQNVATACWACRRKPTNARFVGGAASVRHGLCVSVKLLVVVGRTRCGCRWARRHSFINIETSGREPAGASCRPGQWAHAGPAAAAYPPRPAPCVGN